MMKVSVVTVCYNSSKTIADTIRSALAQKDVDLEYLIIDGHSKDNTVEIIRQTLSDLQATERVRFISEPDKGMYDALNKGTNLASGDIVGLLNSDDVFEDEFALARIVAAFDNQTDAVYGDIRFVRGDSDETTRYYSAQYWRPWMARWGFMPPHPSVYIRREFFDKLGGYKLGYRISADFELMTRYFCQAKIRTKYLNSCVVKMRLGGMSTAGFRAMLTLNRENVRALRENGIFSCLLMMLPKYAYKIFGYLKRG